MHWAARGARAAVLLLLLTATPAGAMVSPRSGVADYPNATWLPASPANYSRSNRPVSARINTIVIHTTEGSFFGTLRWFRNPAARASTQYVVRSRDGRVTEMVRETDEAWHSGNGRVNAASIGIEHEAFIANCSYYTDAMYRSSAQLVAYLAAKYGVSIDRRHIIGHSEVPDPNHRGRFGGAGHHTDPGRCWDWNTYMALVRLYAGLAGPGTGERLVDDTVRGSLSLSPGWRVRAAGAGRFGPTYRIGAPSATGGEARFKLSIPVTGRYAVYASWPADRFQSSSAPIGVETSTGVRVVRMDQRRNGGRWTYLGTYPLRAGTGWKVRFSRRTDAPGTIAADAVKARLVRMTPASQLVEPGRGWVLTSKQLSWTGDGGRTWQAITPPGLRPDSIRGARFSDRRHGWLVASTDHAGKPLALYRSSDGGARWTSSALPAIPDIDAAAPVSIDQTEDDLAVAVRLQPTPKAFSRGLLLQSRDGGDTWTSSSLPVAGSIELATAGDDWLAGGLVPERLFRTRDGGQTWRRVALPAPVTGRASLVYGLPRASAAGETVVAVSATAAGRSTLAFQATRDGSTWRTAVKLRLPQALGFGARVPTAVLPDGRWLAAVGGRQVVALARGSATAAAVGRLPAAASALDFVSPTSGWGTLGGGCTRACLVATSDGGATWTRLRPP